MVASPYLPPWFAVDDRYVYVFTAGSSTMAGAIARFPQAGGAGERILDGIDTSVDSDLLVDDTSLYWLVNSTHSIIRLPKGGAPSAIELARLGGPTTNLVEDAAHLYVGVHSSASIVAVDKLTGAMRTVVTAVNPRQLALDDGYLYWTRGDGTFDGVSRVEKAGGTPVSVVQWYTSPYNGGLAWFLAVDDRYVFASDGWGGVTRADKGERQLPTALFPDWGSSDDRGYITSVASDGTSVFAGRVDGPNQLQLRRAGTDGSGARTIDGHSDPSVIVVEGDSVYYHGLNDENVPAVKRVCR